MLNSFKPLVRTLEGTGAYSGPRYHRFGVLRVQVAKAAGRLTHSKHLNLLTLRNLGTLNIVLPKP